MQIPKTFKLGDKLFIVRKVARLINKRWGLCYPSHGAIYLATTDKGKQRPLVGPKGLGVSFWHETVHAILYDMGDPRWNDEKFVTEFSKRLGQVTESAVL